jgi:VWFA-related protein
MIEIFMKRTIAVVLSMATVFSVAFSQTPPGQKQEIAPEDVVRITTALVQTNVVVTDKNDHVIPDLKLGDFDIYENGKKQDLKFMEFVSTDTGRRTEGERPASLPEGAEVPHDVKTSELKRVIAFVVDDLTIPFADMAAVRQLLLDFVNKQMMDGDLVAIIRVIGGKGLLQQFTTDRQLLRRAIAQLSVSTNPYSAFNNPAQDRQTSVPQRLGAGASDSGISTPSQDVSFEDQGMVNFSDPNDDTQRLFRGLMSLTTAEFVVDSLKEIPGRKSLVLISGGIPIFETSSTGTVYSNVSYLLHHLSDHAIRAGVAVNTLDPRGLKASAGVVGFDMTPARSGLASEDPNFGRGGSSAMRADAPGSPNDDPFGGLLAGGSEHLGLDTLAKETGGISVVNTNDFKSGLDKVLARSSYYLLAYTPTDKFDNKFRRIEIKVKRDGARVYAHRGYVAREERASATPRTKEQAIVLAAKSPLSHNDLDVTANVVVKPLPAANKSEVGIHISIDANKLTFTQGPDGKHQTAFDVVGFIYDQFGKLRGGFSETINANLADEDYRQALKTGLTYSANTDLPSGYFQVRVAVREASTGNLGTISRYLELPDLSKGRLAMSSIFLFAVNAADNKATPTPLLAVRQLPHQQDLRYAALIYNAKASGGKQQLRARMIISQGAKILYQEPDQPIESATTSPVSKIGQMALGKVPAGRYVLTLIVTDPLADKKSDTVARSIEFTVAN